MQKDRLRATVYVLSGLCAGVALVLCCDGGPGKTGADDGGIGVDMTMGGAPPGSPTRVITADTDAMRIETGTVTKYDLKCTFLSAGAPVCARAIDGPFVLTDLQSQVAIRQNDVIAFVANNDAQLGMDSFVPRWQFGGTGNTDAYPNTLNYLAAVVTPATGMRLLVRSDEKLYIAYSPAGSGNTPVLWSGYRPY